jgi:hypothetical protein
MIFGTEGSGVPDNIHHQWQRATAGRIPLKNGAFHRMSRIPIKIDV